MTILSIVEPIVLVLCLAVGLNQVQRRLNIISNGLGDLGGMLATVESQHLRPLSKLVADVNGPLNTINATLPGIAAKAAVADMDNDLALWIMVIVLIAVIPVVVGLLKKVLGAARSIPPRIDAIAGVATAASSDLDAVVILLTTQNYISQIVASVANYGGSLNVALPDY